MVIASRSRWLPNLHQLDLLRRGISASGRCSATWLDHAVTFANWTELLVDVFQAPLKTSA
jgi:hypothetical protein